MHRAWVVVPILLFSAVPVGAQEFDQPEPPPAPETPRAPVLTRSPTVKKEGSPVYPPEALAAGLSADVTLTIDIDAGGRVTSAAIARSAGDAFDQAALDAARAMEFTPAEIDGKPAPIRIEYVIHFRPALPLHAETAPPPPPPPPPAPPPPLVLRGRIREKGTREPIAAATVLVVRRGVGPKGVDAPAEEIALSGVDGSFEARFGGAPNGARLMVTDAAHETCVRDLTAAETAGATPIDWTCFARRTEIGFETHVRAQRATADVTRHTLSPAELTTVPGTFGDPPRVIQSLPGVARPPYGLGLLVVRGAPPTDTGVFASGQNIPHLYHFLVGPGVLAPHLIERVDFFPGGFGVRYGRVSGGVVDVVLKEGPAERLHGGADLSVLDVSAYAEGPLRAGTSATVAIRRSTIDATLPLVIPSEQGSTFVTTVPVYWDYQARVVQELGGARRVGLTAFGSDDSLKVVTQDPQAGNFSLRSHAGFHRVVGFWSSHAGPWTWRLAPAYGNGDESFTLGASNGYIRYQRLFLRAELSRSIGKRLDLRAGFDGLLSYDTAYFDILFPREGRTFGNTTLELTQASRRLIDYAPAYFVEGEWRPMPNLRIVPGLRFDQYYVVGLYKQSLDPRLAIRWTVRPASILKGGAGIYHQLPVPQFLDREFGNPRLALIWSDQYHLGFEQSLTRALNLDVTAYYVRRHDLPVPSTERFSSTGRGRGFGLEVWLRHQVTERFFGWLAYTLSWSEQTAATAQEMVSRAPGGDDEPNSTNDYHPSPYDQRHNLIAVASYRRRGWQLGARYRLVSGRPANAVSGSFYDADFGGYTPQSTPASIRLPLFSQLDLRVERTFTFDYWTLGVYLDVQNVFNAENPESFVYDYRYRQQAAVRGLPILPVLGLRGRF